MFKELKSGKLFDAAKVEQYMEDHVYFIRCNVHPVMDAMNTGYNFALRSNPINTDTNQAEECLEVSGSEEGVKARLMGTELQGYGNMTMPNPHYTPDPVIREIVSRMTKKGVVFFEEDHEFTGICSYIAANASRDPQMFLDPFGGAILVMDDQYREQDLTVRFFPRL